MAYTLRHAGWSYNQHYKTHYQVSKTYFCDKIVYLRAGNIGLPPIKPEYEFRVWLIQILVWCLSRRDLEVSSRTSLVTYKMSSTRWARDPGDSPDLTLASEMPVTVPGTHSGRK